MSNFTIYFHLQTRAVCCFDYFLQFCRFCVGFWYEVCPPYSFEEVTILIKVKYALIKLAHLNFNPLISKFIYF